MQLLSHRPLFKLLRQTHPDFDQWFASKVTVLSGDLSKPDCGLSPAAYATVVKEVNYIIHSAASTSFADPLPSLLKSNYWASPTRRSRHTSFLTCLCMQCFCRSGCHVVCSCTFNPYIKRNFAQCHQVAEDIALEPGDANL